MRRNRAGNPAKRFVLFLPFLAASLFFPLEPLCAEPNYSRFENVRSWLVEVDGTVTETDGEVTRRRVGANCHNRKDHIETLTGVNTTTSKFKFSATLTYRTGSDGGQETVTTGTVSGSQTRTMRNSSSDGDHALVTWSGSGISSDVYVSLNFNTQEGTYSLDFSSPPPLNGAGMSDATSYHDLLKSTDDPACVGRRAKRETGKADGWNGTQIDLKQFISKVFFKEIAEKLQAGILDGGAVRLPMEREPLPERGLELSGSFSKSDSGDPVEEKFDDGGGRTATSSITVRANWKCTPDPGDRPVLLVRVGQSRRQYEEWLPEGVWKNENSTAGNTLEVAAELQTPDGRPARQTAEKFLFELVNTSSEIGSSMNRPEALAGDMNFDIRIDPQENPVLKALDGEKGQRAESKPQGGGVTSGAATLSCYDWGGWTTLRVTAIMPDGGASIEGLLEWDKATRDIPVPRRVNGSRIADFWKQSAGVSAQDADDGETDPKGDGHPGDGLTLYEEYRGFYMTPHEGGVAEHRRLDPKKKDFFLVDEAPIGGKAFGMFRDLSGLDVHRIVAGEMTPQRVVNFNHTQAPHVVDQHAVVIRRNANPDYSISVGKHPGTPAKVLRIEMGEVNKLAALQPDGSRRVDWDSVAVHELLHACSVWHHGDKDKKPRKWTIVTDAAGARRVAENGQIVRVFDEQGDPADLAAVRLIELHGPRSAPVWEIEIGERQGQHSGAENCIMRYAVSEAYVPPGMPADTRILTFGEKTGSGICGSPKGTGVNAAVRDPANPSDPFKQSRYGDADSANRRGNCASQICINDLYADDDLHDRFDVSAP